MSDKELSLEARASAAYVQGRLTELASWIRDHDMGWLYADKLTEIIDEWKQAEAELKAKHSRDDATWVCGPWV